MQIIYLGDFETGKILYERLFVLKRVGDKVTKMKVMFVSHVNNKAKSPLISKEPDLKLGKRIEHLKILVIDFLY